MPKPSPRPPRNRNDARPPRGPRKAAPKARPEPRKAAPKTRTGPRKAEPKERTGPRKAVPKARTEPRKGSPKARPAPRKALPKGTLGPRPQARKEAPAPAAPAAVRPPPPPRADLPPAALFPLPGVGTWIYACREGYEADLAEELETDRPKEARDMGVRVLVPALISTEGRPPRRDRRIELTFARQAFPVVATVVADNPADLAERVFEAVRPALGPRQPFVLHTFSPDSDAGNRLASAASALHAELERRLDANPALAARRGRETRASGGLLMNVCLVEKLVAIIGALPAAEALSHRPGGRARVGISPRAPSRAAMKLDEALDWLGVEPAAGDLCVDLGAAPGGWTFVLAERRASVVAVDLGRLRPDIAARKNVAYVKTSAFNFAPDETVDWLFCDMAWRPLEVAALLAKWGRNRWARILVANIKLPMTRKVPMLKRIREILETGTWKDVRTRHLYHDRDEITLTAWLR